VSEENVAFVRALFEGADSMDREALLALLPEAVPQAFTEDAVWEEDPSRADRQVWRGHEGILASWQRWLDQWEEWTFEVEEVEDHGDQVLCISREHGRGGSSGANVSATNHLVLTFRDGKISRYQEFYDEGAARAELG
jgi:ketosteroid isomerase-like protein